MEHRSLKACQVCGAAFAGARDMQYCPECAQAKKRDTVVKTRICIVCKTAFYGGARASRCPSCAYEARILYKRKPPKRPIGSIDKCVVCQEEYVVAGSRSKYCSADCRRIGVLEWQRKHKKGYYESSGQREKKEQRRKNAMKVCVYCLIRFKSNTSTNVCSDFCRTEQKKLIQCIVDIKRGKKRDLARYEVSRQLYREHIAKTT